MQILPPQGIQVSVASDASGVRFSSTNAEALCEFALSLAQRRGMRDVGAIRSGVLELTPELGNLEPLFGIPTPYRLFLVSHCDLEFAGNREPQTVTVYCTTTPVEQSVTEGFTDKVCYNHSYHFTLALK